MTSWTRPSAAEAVALPVSTLRRGLTEAMGRADAEEAFDWTVGLDAVLSTGREISRPRDTGRASATRGCCCSGRLLY